MSKKFAIWFEVVGFVYVAEIFAFDWLNPYFLGSPLFCVMVALALLCGVLPVAVGVKDDDRE